MPRNAGPLHGSPIQQNVLFSARLLRSGFGETPLAEHVCMLVGLPLVMPLRH